MQLTQNGGKAGEACMAAWLRLQAEGTSEHAYTGGFVFVAGASKALLVVCRWLVAWHSVTSHSVLYFVV